MYQTQEDFMLEQLSWLEAYFCNGGVLNVVNHLAQELRLLLQVSSYRVCRGFILSAIFLASLVDHQCYPGEVACITKLDA